MDYDQLRNRLYLDTIVFGEYPEAFKEYLIQRNAMPDVTIEDMAVMKAAHPDFIAFNYYGGSTVKYVNEEDGLAAKKAVAKEGANMEEFMTGMMTEPGMAVGCKNLRRIIRKK